jgi:hypothetical protein
VFFSEEILYTVVINGMRDFFVPIPHKTERKIRMNQIRDGDLYKTINVFGKRFDLRYGYYEEFERARGEPIPIYPDFRENPVYTEDGHPFVTQMQDLCRHGESKFRDGCCADCKYYKNGEDLVGICLCEKNRKQL